MLIRLQSPTPAMLETSFRLAAQYGYAIDICPAFGSMHEAKPQRVEKSRIESKPPKTQPKAPKAPKARPAAPKATPKATPAPSPTPADPALAALRATGKALRAEAESGAFRLSPKVYGDLRSKDAVKLAEAVRIAEGVRFTAIPSGDLGGEKKAAKPKRAPNPYRNIPLSERRKLSASTAPASEASKAQIAEDNHKAFLRDFPLLGENDALAELAAIEAAMAEDGDCVDCGATLEECECDSDAEQDETAELDFEA